MLETIFNLGQKLEQPENSATLKMISHERMAGSVPLWKKASTAKQDVSQKFADVLNDKIDTSEDSPFLLGLSSEKTVAQETGSTEKPFGFGDLLDIINPLHHIPVIGSFYREMSGDEIRGPGRIMGGALFGGPLGAGAAMVNMLIEFDTGRDLSKHALEMATGSTQQKESIKEGSNLQETNEHLRLSGLSNALLSYQEETNIQTTRL